MALARGKYGIEYNPRPLVEKPSGGVGWIVAVVAVLALVSLGWTIAERIRAQCAERRQQQALAPPPERGDAPAAHAGPAAETNGVAQAQPPAPPPENVADYLDRPPKVRNLLMRLNEAEKNRDIEMAASTIETLRTLQGAPIADLDDKLARRLGELNMRRLFERRNPKWVDVVTVRMGDSASRIASSHGSTLASFARLNGNKVDRIDVGKKMYVLAHPKFSVIVHRRSRTADVQLKGIFFKRYDFSAEVKVKNGAYALAQPVRAFWNRLGVAFKSADRAEIDMLLPLGTTVIVSEM